MNAASPGPLCFLLIVITAVPLSVGCSDSSSEGEGGQPTRPACCPLPPSPQPAAGAPVTTAPVGPRVQASRRVHVFVSGRVQGVSFRAFTRAHAGRLGLVGFVKNLADRRVEAVIEGPPDQVAALLEQMNQGPPAARVDDLQVKDEPPQGNFDTFEVRR